MHTYPYPDIEVPELGQRKTYLREACAAHRENQFERALKLIKTLVIFYVPPSSLTSRERQMLVAAYVSVYNGLVTAFEAASARERVEGPGPASLERSIAESEIRKVCNSICNLIDERLLPSVSNTEEDQRVVGVYLRIRGDFSSYLCSMASISANDAYNASRRVLVRLLPASDPVWLIWAINCSVFVRSILRKPDLAIKDAERAYTMAMNELSVRGEMPVSTFHLLKRLRQNISLWKSQRHAAAAQPMVPAITNNLAPMTAGAPVGAGSTSGPCCCGPDGAAVAPFCLAAHSSGCHH